MLLSPGQIVLFMGVKEHIWFPEFYPVVGSIGVVKVVSGFQMLVEWKEGFKEKEQNKIYPCNYDNVAVVNSNFLEIFDTLKRLHSYKYNSLRYPDFKIAIDALEEKLVNMKKEEMVKHGLSQN